MIMMVIIGRYYDNDDDDYDYRQKNMMSMGIYMQRWQIWNVQLRSSKYTIHVYSDTFIMLHKPCHGMSIASIVLPSHNKTTDGLAGSTARASY